MRPLRVRLPPGPMLAWSRGAGLIDMLLKTAQVLLRPSFMRSSLPSMNVTPPLPMSAALTMRGEEPRLTVYTARSEPLAPRGPPSCAAPIPYLKGVDDPYDYYGSLHDWGPLRRRASRPRCSRCGRRSTRSRRPGWACPRRWAPLRRLPSRRRRCAGLRCRCPRRPGCARRSTRPRTGSAYGSPARRREPRRWLSSGTLLIIISDPPLRTTRITPRYGPLSPRSVAVRMRSAPELGVKVTGELKSLRTLPATTRYEPLM